MRQNGRSAIETTGGANKRPELRQPPFFSRILSQSRVPRTEKIFFQSRKHKTSLSYTVYDRTSKRKLNKRPAPAPVRERVQAVLTFQKRFVPLCSESIRGFCRGKKAISHPSFSIRFINPFNLPHIQDVSIRKKGVKRDAVRSRRKKSDGKEGITL